MREIKTIVRMIGSGAEFDREVNRLLADGWILSKRELRQIRGEISDAYNAPDVPVLYAELERWEPIDPDM